MSSRAMKAWQDKLVVSIIWLVTAWVIWDFLRCIDPPVPRDTITHPLRITPRE